MSTVARELQRNTSADGSYQPHAAQAMMRARRPRPKQRLLERDGELRGLVQGYLDQRWSPEQIAHELAATHGHPIAVETIYQALYSPMRVIEREASSVLRTERPHRRPRRRGDERRPRFVVPITLIDQRPMSANDRCEAGHWEGDLIVGAFNRSAIGTLVERTSRFCVLVHLDPAARSDSLRLQLESIFSGLPASLRRQRSLTWDQGSKPWQRPSNENTNGLLRNYFPKSSDLRVYTEADLARVADELNRRPRKTLDWQTPAALFATLRTGSA